MGMKEYQVSTHHRCIKKLLIKNKTEFNLERDQPQKCSNQTKTAVRKIYTSTIVYFCILLQWAILT